MDKPTIILTNDDGIHAPGLKHLWKALEAIADLYIFAPSSEQSGVGASVTLHQPITVSPVSWENDTPAWKVTGTPADCVRMGTRVVLKKNPDMIVSGINKGSNSGKGILFSGTVGGVIDGALRGIPGIAFSCEDFENPNYHCFEPEIALLVKYLLKDPLPLGSFLNVNFPSAYEFAHKGIRLARQGLGYWRENPIEGNHPNGWNYYWMGSDWLEETEHEESDVELLRQGYVTVVPIHVQDLTHWKEFESRKKHFEQFFQLKR